MELYSFSLFFSIVQFIILAKKKFPFIFVSDVFNVRFDTSIYISIYLVHSYLSLFFPGLSVKCSKLARPFLFRAVAKIARKRNHDDGMSIGTSVIGDLEPVLIPYGKIFLVFNNMNLWANVQHLHPGVWSSVFHLHSVQS